MTQITLNRVTTTECDVTYRISGDGYITFVKNGSYWYNGDGVKYQCPADAAKALRAIADATGEIIGYEDVEKQWSLACVEF